MACSRVLTIETTYHLSSINANGPALRRARAANSLQEAGSARREALVAFVLEEVVELPALDLVHHLVELRVRDGLVDEAFAAAELREVPRVIGFEFGRHRELPQRQVFGEI